MFLKYRQIFFSGIEFRPVFFFLLGVMTVQNILNFIGLITGMAGAYLMYHFTPKANSRTFIYTRTEQEVITKKDVYKNKVVRFGMLLLFVGFLLQVVALLIRK